MTQARSTRQPVVVASSISETTQTVANPDGTFTMASARQAVRTKNPAGSWVPIDTTLTAGKDGRLRPNATTLDVSLSGGGKNAAISLHKGATGVDLAFPFELPRPTVNGATATYSEVLPGVDLQLTAYPEHVAEVLVIKNAVAAKQPKLAALALTVDTTGGALTVAADGSSTVNDVNGIPVFRAAPPTMWDSRPDTSGTPNATRSSDNDRKVPTAATSNAARKSTATVDYKTVTLAPEPAALTGADVVYPIYLDPSFGIGRSNFLVVRTSGQNYWTNTDVLRVGYCAWAGCSPYSKARSFFDFAYGTLAPRNGLAAQISSASVTVTQVSAASSWGTPVTLAQAGAINPGQGFGGPLGAALQTINTAAGAGTVVRFDNTAVRDFAQQGAQGGWSTITFALNSPNEADANQWKKFDNNPTLNVNYIFPPLTPSDLREKDSVTCPPGGTTWVNSTDVTLQAKVNDNGNQVGVYQDFDLYKVGGVLVGSGWTYVPAGAGIASKQFTGLSDRTSYYFITRSSARDLGLGAWAYSPDVRSSDFTVVKSAPATPTVYSPDFPKNNDETNPNSGLFGATHTEAQTQPATFTLTSNDETTIAFSYNWNADTTPDPDECQANAAPGADGNGFVQATIKSANLRTATISYPPGDAPIKLTVGAITAGGNVSTLTVYEIRPWWSESTKRVEATPAQFTTSSMTKSIDQTNPDLLSDGNQVRLTTTGNDQDATHLVPMTDAGTYILTIEFSTGPNSGAITLHPVSGTCTPASDEALPVDLYSPSVGKRAVSFAPMNDDGEVGWTCDSGAGTIGYRIDAASLTAGHTIDIDYIRGLNDSPATPSPSTLAPGTQLLAGQELAASSATSHYRLRLRTDCDLALYKDGLPTWASGTARPDTQCHLDMQTDGNLVLYTSAGNTVWNSNTASFPGASLTLQSDGNLAITRNAVTLWSTLTGYKANMLIPGEQLAANDLLYTAGRAYRLILQTDCNLVVYQGATAVWNSGTTGHTNCRAAMQTDGNFVIYSGTTALWFTGTQNQSIARLSLENDGRLLVITTSGSTAWASRAA